MANVAENDVVVAGKTPRILAFDLIRGFFLLVIMIDHVELYPNIFDFLTGKGRLWVSAAEGFFFLSGLLIGMMYKRRLRLGMKFIFRKMWKRAVELYIVGTGFTFLYLCWVEFTNHSPIKDALPSPLPWHHVIEQTLLMRFTYGWADFLVRFALLMLMAPFVFRLVAKGKWWLALAGIWGIWLFRGQGFTWSWQLIFNLGILLGYYWKPIQVRFGKLKAERRRLIKLGVGAAAVLSFAASYASVYVLSLLYHLWGDNLLPHWLQHVAYDWGNWNYDVWLYADKWTMGPLRILLFFLWFPTLYWIVRRYEPQISRYSRGVLEMLGRNSLFVYSVHSIIIFALKMYLIPPQTNVLQNFLITGLGLMLLIAITRLYVHFRPKLKAIRIPVLGWRAEKAGS